MAILTKNQILKANDIVTKKINAFGGEVIISTISAQARESYEKAVIDVNGKVSGSNIRARLLAVSIVDEDGTLLFNESDIKDLGKKSATEVDKLFSAILKLNGMGDDNVEEVAKN